MKGKFKKIDKPLADIGKPDKGHLIRMFPFLRKSFRTLEHSELNSVLVFEELFPYEKKVDLSKLKAIYEYQK